MSKTMYFILKSKTGGASKLPPVETPAQMSEAEKEKARSGELSSHMKKGTQALTEKHHNSAVSYYNKALHLIKDYQIKTEEMDVILLKYSIGVAYVGLGHVKDLKQAIYWYNEIVKKHSRVKIPLSYLGLGKAYHRWNRFTDSLEPLRKGLKMVSEIKQATEKHWPGTDTVIEETQPGQLKVALESYLKMCLQPPRPVAVCRYAECNGYYKVQIYHSDPDFKGFIRLCCFAKCIIEYHLECWKEVKAPRLSDKEMLCRTCFTPDCSATIWKIITFDHAGDKSREIVATREKQIKPKPKNHKLHPSNQVKIAMRKERKNIRKLKKEEARIRMGSDNENTTEKNDTKSEQAAPHTDNVEIIPVNLEEMIVLKKPENKDEDFYKVVKPSGKAKNKKKQHKVKSVMTLEEFVGNPEGDEMPSMYEYVEHPGFDFTTNYESDSSSTSTPYSQYSGSMGIDSIDMPPLPTNNAFSRFRFERTSISELDPPPTALSTMQGSGEPTVIVGSNVSHAVEQVEPESPSGGGWRKVGRGDAITDAPEQKETVDNNPPAPTVDIKDQIFESFANFLKQQGPMHLKDQILLDEVNQLEPEAQTVIESSGGCIGKFLKQSLQFSLIDNFICLMQEAVQARQLSRDRKKALLQKSRTKQAAAKSKIQLKSTENTAKPPPSPGAVKKTASLSSTSSSTHSSNIFVGLSGETADSKKGISALDYFDSTKPVGKLNEFFGGEVDLPGMVTKRIDDDERRSSVSADGSSSLVGDRRKGSRQDSGSYRADDYYTSDVESGTSELQETQSSSGSSSNAGELTQGSGKAGIPNLTHTESGSAINVTSSKSNLTNSSVSTPINLISPDDDVVFPKRKTRWDANKRDLVETEIVDSIQLPRNSSPLNNLDGAGVGDPGKLNGLNIQVDGSNKSNGSSDGEPHFLGRYMETNRIWGRQGSSSPSVSTPGSASPGVKQNRGSKDYLSDLTSQPLVQSWSINGMNDNPIPIPDTSKPPPGFEIWGGTGTNWSSVLKQGEIHCKESQLLKEATMREAFSLAPGSPSSVGHAPGSPSSVGHVGAPGSPSSVGHVGAERSKSDSGRGMTDIGDGFLNPNAATFEPYKSSLDPSLANINQSSFSAFTNPATLTNQDVDDSINEKLEKVDEGLMKEIGEQVYKTLHRHEAFQSKPSLLGDIMRDIRHDFKASQDASTHFPSIHEPASTNTTTKQTNHIGEVNYNKRRVEMVDKWVNTSPYKPDSAEMNKLLQQRDTYYADVKNAIEKYAQLQSVYTAELAAKKVTIEAQQKDIRNVKDELSLVVGEKDEEIGKLQVEKGQLLKQIKLLAGKIEETKMAERRLAAELKVKEREIQILSEKQENSSMGYNVDHYQEELEHLQQRYTTELSRAEAAEAQLLQAKYDLGAQTLENSYKHAELVIKQLTQLINMRMRNRYLSDDTPVPQLLLSSLDQWNANVQQLRKIKIDYQTGFEEKLRQVKAGNPLDTLPDLMVPQPPAPPQSPGQVAMFFQSGRDARGLQAVKSDLGWSGTPASGDAVSEQQSHMTPDSISGLSSLYGVSDSASAPLLRGRGQEVKKTGKKRSSFSNIVDALTAKFPTYQKVDIERHLRQLRAEKNGSLSGMRVEDIQQQVSDRIRQEQLTIATEASSSRLRAPPGLSLQFSDIVSGRGPVVHDNGNGRCTPSSLGSEIFEDDAEDPCIICHEQLKPHNTKGLACGHRFHFECIKKWLREQSTCPVCREHALLPEEFPSLY